MSFWGAREREPGIYSSTVIAARWIPGLRLTAHPGMTEDLARDDGATYRIRGGFFANATAIAEINGFMK